ncbi:MAG: YCF48-related protein [Ignavibacteriaceae bacterium]
MRIKIYQILLLFFLLNSTLFSQYFWEKIESPTTEFLRTLHFADSLTGWVAGDSGLIFFTSDGGKNWVQQTTNTKNKIMNLFFIDNNRGWAVSWDEEITTDFTGTYFLKTTNGGLNWSLDQYREDNVFLNNLYFLDTLKGFAGGYPGKFLVTTDGGTTWENAHIDSMPGAFFPPANFKFYNNDYGFAVGGQIDISGVVWKTTDGGANWKPAIVGAEPIYDLHFFDSLNVLGVGGDFEYGASVIQTSDAGETWDYRTVGIFGVATSLSFRTATEAWVPLSISQTLMYTLDAGETWTDTSAVDSSSIYDLVFSDSLTGFAVGEEGVILKYRYQFPDFVVTDKFITQDYYLFQNYPNPFNSSTTVEYRIIEPAYVSLKIYDVLGNYISTLIKGFQQSGNHKINWDANGKPSGVYYLSLAVNANVLTKKMILLK